MILHKSIITIPENYEPPHSAIGFILLLFHLSSNNLSNFMIHGHNKHQSKMCKIENSKTGRFVCTVLEYVSITVVHKGIKCHVLLQVMQILTNQ